MEVTPTGFRDLYVCKPQIFKDSRGYFMESYNQRKLEEATGLHTHFVQDNQSVSQYGVIRGLHMQMGAFGQAKLVRCAHGKILDVVVDMRTEEPTFGTHYAIELSEENQLQLFIPRGFAHGFSVLSESAVFMYKCDQFYHQESEICMAYNDPHLGIDWQIPTHQQILSEKDKEGLDFKTASAVIASHI